jgi:hypothetical protein
MGIHANNSLRLLIILQELVSQSELVPTLQVTNQQLPCQKKSAH